MIIGGGFCNLLATVGGVNRKLAVLRARMSKVEHNLSPPLPGSRVPGSAAGWPGLVIMAATGHLVNEEV